MLYLSSNYVNLSKNKNELIGMSIFKIRTKNGNSWSTNTIKKGLKSTNPVRRVGPRDCHTEVSQTEKDKHHMISHMCGI